MYTQNTFRLISTSIILLAAGSLVAQNSFSAETVKKASKSKVHAVAEAPVAPTPAPAPVSTYSYSTQSQSSIKGSIGAIDGQLFYGPGFQMEWPVVLDGGHYAFGFETGFYYSSRSESINSVTAKSKAFTIPVFVTAKYLISNNVDFIKPYFALDMGPTIDHVTGDINVSGTVVGKTDTTVRFGFLLRPGVTIGMAQKWFIETPFGLLFSEFAILPSIGVHF